MYIQRCQGRIAEATAKHFMQQLASGLKILCENNLIHRDLKPQKLLLSATDDNSTLKIADFGFARSLQPRVLAETLCGSPLYMAPEIMQLQKYDAKGDLWSVGAILFQLVTGKTPFTGNNQIQLLHNIVNSTKLQFPLDAENLRPHCIDLCRKLLHRNPVERLTFEEFFNQPFLAQKQLDELSWNQRPQSVIDGLSLTERNPVRSTGETFQEDGFTFSLDDDSSSPEGGPPFVGYHRDLPVDFLMIKIIGKKLQVLQTKLLIEWEYVLVSGSIMDSSSSAGASRLCNTPFRSSCPLHASGNIDSRLTSQGSTDVIDPLERRTDGIAELSRYNITARHHELVNEKIAAGRHLEAFSIELVILAVCKQALHVCHTQAASTITGSPNQETTKLMEILKESQVSPNIKKDTSNTLGPENVLSHIQRTFLNEVWKAEELAKHIEPGNAKVPDAMEMIFQSTLDLGRKAAVEEYMSRTEIAVVFYSKAARLLAFLQVEAPSLVLCPPFSLTNSDRCRLGSYIDVLKNRQSVSRSQITTLLKCEDQH
ncbi:unnamed protein product [Withania somnifera]